MSQPATSFETMLDDSRKCTYVIMHACYCYLEVMLGNRDLTTVYMPELYKYAHRGEYPSVLGANVDVHFLQ